MKTEKGRYRLTILAAAIGLACGGTALAGHGAVNETGNDRYVAYNQSNQEQYPEPESDKQYPSTSQNRTNASDYGQEQRSTSVESRSNTTLLTEEIKSSKNLSEFADAVEKAGLADALNDGTEYTVFAPTDEAFEKFTAENGDLSDEKLREVLRNHIVAGKVNATRAKELDSARVLTGDTVELKTSGETLEVGEAKVVEADISSDNLTIHTIDAVLAANIDQDWSEEEESE